MAGETYQIKGQQCKWGTTSTHGSGVVTDESLKRQSQTEPVENAQGATTGLVIYDEKWSGQLTIVANANAPAPQIGGTLTVCGQTLFITEVEEKGSHKGKFMYVVTAEGGKYLNIS